VLQFTRAIGVSLVGLNNAITIKFLNMFTNITTNPTDTQYYGKEILSVKEACLYMDISQSYIYKLTHGRILPFSCPNGKKIYFRKEDLDNWMMRNHQFSKSEIREQAASYIANKKTGSYGK